MLNFATYKASPLQFNEEPSVQANGNIVVGNYETQNFGFCPAAIEAFSNYDLSSADIEHVKMLEHAANQIDLMFGVEMDAIRRGVASGEATATFFGHLDAAEEILDELGILEDHGYLREVHESRMIDLMDISGWTPDDEELNADESELDMDDSIFSDDFTITDEDDDDDLDIED